MAVAALVEAAAHSTRGHSLSRSAISKSTSAVFIALMRQRWMHWMRKVYSAARDVVVGGSLRTDDLDAQHGLAQ